MYPIPVLAHLKVDKDRTVENGGDGVQGVRIEGEVGAETDRVDSRLGHYRWEDMLKKIPLGLCL